MVEVVYKITDGTSYSSELEACRNDFKWLRNRRDSLHTSLMRMKQESLPRYTREYMSARARAGAKMEDVRKNDNPKRNYLVRQAYYEALAKKFAALDELQMEIRVYKKLRAEYKEKAEECRKAFERYKDLEAKE